MPEQGPFTFLDFTFDPASGDLFRGDIRVRVPRQPSDLLAIFLQSGGRVITRGELQKLLWPNGEFLDHEQAINRTITDLRAVLRDNPRNPKYIETVHKRGYRFLPLISVVDSASGPAAIAAGADKDAYPPEVNSEAVTQTRSTSDSSYGPLELTASGADGAARTWHRKKWWLPAIVIVLAGIATVLGFHILRSRRAPTENSVVYLGIVPFESEGPDAEEIGESFRQDLADALAQLPVVQIRATNSLSKMGHDDASIRGISEKLHIDVLLLGTFHVKDDQCKMRFELVRGRDAVHLASFEYTGRKDELALIRDKLQGDVFRSLQGKDTSAQSIRGSTNDPQAYALYLDARELSRIRDAGALNQALAKYEQAIQRDGRFARAYAGMATTQLSLRYFDVSEAAAHQNQAKLLAQQSLQLDPQLAEPHAVLGDVAFRSVWDFSLGEGELRRAVELEPQKAIYHTWLAALLADERRFGEAQAEIDLAIADDPLWPAVYSMATFVAGVAGDDEKMLGYVKKYVSLVPDSSYSHDQLAWAYFSAKHYDEAMAEWTQMATMDKDADRLALETRGRKAYRRAGIMGYALTRLDAIERNGPEIARHANDFVPAEWYAFAGQRDKALIAIRQLIEQHDREAVQLAVNPMFNSLQGDPRFVALLHQVGFNFSSTSRPPTTGR